MVDNVPQFTLDSAVQWLTTQAKPIYDQFKAANPNLDPQKAIELFEKYVKEHYPQSVQSFEAAKKVITANGRQVMDVLSSKPEDAWSAIKDMLFGNTGGIIGSVGGGLGGFALGNMIGNAIAGPVLGFILGVITALIGLFVGGGIGNGIHQAVTGPKETPGMVKLVDNGKPLGRQPLNINVKDANQIIVAEAVRGSDGKYEARLSVAQVTERNTAGQPTKIGQPVPIGVQNIKLNDKGEINPADVINILSANQDNQEKLATASREATGAAPAQPGAGPAPPAQPVQNPAKLPDVLVGSAQVSDVLSTKDMKKKLKELQDGKTLSDLFVDKYATIASQHVLVTQKNGLHAIISGQVIGGNKFSIDFITYLKDKNNGTTEGYSGTDKAIVRLQKGPLQLAAAQGAATPVAMLGGQDDDAKAKKLGEEFRAGLHNDIPVEGTNANLSNGKPRSGGISPTTA